MQKLEIKFKDHRYTRDAIVVFDLEKGYTIVEKDDTTRILLCYSRDFIKEKGRPQTVYYQRMNNSLAEFKTGFYNAGDCVGAPQSHLQSICPFN